MQSCSKIFKTLHNEISPVGKSGQNKHFSVLRAGPSSDMPPNFEDISTYQDFVILWGKGHNIKVIEIVERLHSEGLLFPVLFVEERKGFLTIIIDKKIFDQLGGHKLRSYKSKVQKITLNPKGPYTEFVYVLNGDLSSRDGLLFEHDGPKHSFQYYESIRKRWNLGVTNNNAKVDYNLLKCG